MAETSTQARPRLRRLEFVRAAAAQAALCVAGLYALARDHAGPLRPGVDAVDSAVRGVVAGPVYGSLRDIPLHLLAFVDRKVDGAAQELAQHLPSSLKAATAKAYAVAREIADEVHRSGVTGASKDLYVRYEPAAKDLYARYEPAAEHLAVSAWRSLNALPLVPQVAQIAVPTAAYWAEKYNRVIVYAAGRAFPGARYLPAIPVDRIAKVFGEAAESAKPMGLDETVGEGSSSSEEEAKPEETAVVEPAPEAKPMDLGAQVE